MKTITDVISVKLEEQEIARLKQLYKSDHEAFDYLQKYVEGLLLIAFKSGRDKAKP